MNHAWIVDCIRTLHDCGRRNGVKLGGLFLELLLWTSIRYLAQTTTQDSDENPLRLKVCVRSTDEGEFEIVV